MKVGVQTRIGKVLPGSRYLEAVKLSRQAKTQLVWMDYYEQCGNAALTCRRFGVSRPTLHKWLKRYRPKDLLSLEDRSRRPKKTRKPTTPLKTVGLVKTLRTKHPEYSKYKLSVIIRDYSLEVSPSITGRIISQHNLFRPKSSKRSRRPIRPGLPKTLKPKGLKATKPGQIFEFDLKHLRSYLGRKLYAFVAVDTFTKKIFIMVSSSISSKQAALAWEGVQRRSAPPRSSSPTTLRKPWRVRQMVAGQLHRPLLRPGRPTQRQSLRGESHRFLRNRMPCLGRSRRHRRGTTENNQCLVS